MHGRLLYGIILFAVDIKLVEIRMQLGLDNKIYKHKFLQLTLWSVEANKWKAFVDFLKPGEPAYKTKRLFKTDVKRYIE